ncbi:hypothetical protein KIKIMORA_04140 [Brevundimonas phage vB_BpoS-Kikimora]|uniref:Uncharacterized protein n=1 Tax=Brevundimonas phage vB_BpoS-Kikimora TaxID=2948601 RepID=A0A9E7MTL6_9CAUD|nr:hypothetical protein KIKIMORA_04140 [Brevundimonas phage vB_BpoS-Kikimora]
MDSKTPAEIAQERDERGLYLSDPDLYAAILADSQGPVHRSFPLAVTGEVAVHWNMSPEEYADQVAPPAGGLLRFMLTHLGYEMTAAKDDILERNPDGPWTLEELDLLFEGLPEEAAQLFPHTTQFQIVEAVQAPDIDDGDEHTRL